MHLPFRDLRTHTSARHRRRADVFAVSAMDRNWTAVLARTSLTALKWSRMLTKMRNFASILLAIRWVRPGT